MQKLLSYVPKCVVPDEEDSFLRMEKPFAALFTLLQAGAATNFVVHDAHLMYTLAHGMLRYTLVPPGAAVTTRDPVTDYNGTLLRPGSGPGGVGTGAIRCVISAGDILVVPSLWAVAFESHRGEAVLYSRRIFWQ